VVLASGALVQIFFGYAHTDQYGQAWGMDDAFISYRYAKNLVEGHGLVYNDGDRVEGYSNFLYVLLVAPAFLFTDGLGAYFWSSAINLLSALIALLLFHGLARERFGAPLATLGSFLLALCPPIWAAVSSGLEAPLVLLITIAVWRGVAGLDEGHRSARLAALSALLVISLLLRADGFILSFIVATFLLTRRRLREMAVLLAVLTAADALYVSWRYAYYGAFFPNTYYVRISGPIAERVFYALKQLLDLSLKGSLLPVLLAFGIALGESARSLARNVTASARSIPFELICMAGLLSYWLVIGGDQLGDRFLIPLFPTGIFLVLKFLSASGPSRVRLFLVLLLICLHLSPMASDPRFQFTSSKYDMWITLGRYLGEWEKGRTIAVDAAGKIPFFSSLRTLDMLGLNEPVIARKHADFFLPGHNKYDAEYVLSRKPDLICAFIDAGDLDLYYGLNRSRYEKAGYEIVYLVSVMTDLGFASVVEVRGESRDKIRQRVIEGFYYAVLSRAEGQGADPPPGP
jgi:hypothetical protein